VSYRLAQLAKHVGARLVGDPDCSVDSVSTLPNARPGSISFLANYRYKRFLLNTRASAVILREDVLQDCPVSALVTDNPYLAYAKAVELLTLEPEPPAIGIHESAVVDSTAEVHPTVSVGPLCVLEHSVCIGPNVVLGPGCIIERNSQIGEGSRLMARVIICQDTVIGEYCLVQPGAVIGSDGFGLANDNGVWVKIRQLGRVIVGNHVEIGANTTIDRGALEDTILEDGVKLDNQIQVGHNVRIGAHTAIAGCVGIAGSANIGAHCAIGGATGIAGHLDIADRVTITGFSRVNSSVKAPGSYTSGTPLQATPEWQKNSARYRQLDAMARRLATLEKKLKKLMTS
jgi:UDP-3-O-[3-hydroxymyristoyl] glucosamine N-acyltransferase